MRRKCHKATFEFAGVTTATALMTVRILVSLVGLIYGVSDLVND
jgi:hypothetical protein